MKNNSAADLTIALPAPAMRAIALLERQGFSSCAVGGCVRDSLLGSEPGDWDIATAATPAQTMECFVDYRRIATGLRHGTVTVLLDGMPLEITTYRVDGVYTDSRHPDSVHYTGSLEEDLARRDFTINAMAYHPARGLADYHNGLRDLREGVVTCVGEPDRRFEEDALRILRAVRFASCLNFSIAPPTRQSMLRLCGRLERIARERIAAELGRAVVGPGFGRAFGENAPILFQVIPALGELNRRYPALWRQTLRQVDRAAPELELRLALLLGNLGAVCAGNPEGGAFAGAVLRGLRFPGNLVTAVEKLVALRDAAIYPQRRELRRQLSDWGEQRFFQLVRLRRARLEAPEVHGERARQREELDRAESMAKALLEEKPCLTLGDLAVKGGDLLAAGVPQGPQVGGLLQYLLGLVLAEQVENRRDALLEAALERRKKMERTGDAPCNTNLLLKGRKDLRGIIVPDKAKDAGGLTPGKDDNAVWRNNTRKAFDDLMED